MNRRMVNYGALPSDLDINQNMQFAMVASGVLAEAIVGSSTWATGLLGTQSPVPSLTINIGRGALGQMSVVDQTNPGTSTILDSADALMKVGINLTATSLTFLAPVTSGQSQTFLIQGQMQEADAGPTVLQYWNASNPAVPLAGPGGSGASNNTLRTQVVALSVVAGAPSSTGFQSTPAAATGWAPLYTITLSSGQTSITTSQIVQHPSATFVPMNLPLIGTQIFALSMAAGLPTNATMLQSLRSLFNVGVSYSGTDNGLLIFPGGVYRLVVASSVPSSPGVQTTTVTLPFAFPNRELWPNLGDGGLREAAYRGG